MAERSHVADQNVLCAADGALDEGADAPVEMDLVQSEPVGLGAKRHPARRIRLLLEDRVELEMSRGLLAGALARCTALAASTGWQRMVCRFSAMLAGIRLFRSQNARLFSAAAPVP
jgi:hypothetical protein